MVPLRQRSVATCYEFKTTPNSEDVNQDLPIGKAIPGAQVFLFDDFKQPVPLDVIGEIFVGGIGLSNGYIGHAKHFNNQRFIQNPLSNEQMLLYKTGDHGFQDQHGVINTRWKNGRHGQDSRTKSRPSRNRTGFDSTSEYRNSCCRHSQMLKDKPTLA